MKLASHQFSALRALLFLAALLSQNAFAEKLDVAPVEMMALSHVAIASGSFEQRKYFTVLKQPIRSQGELYFDVDKGLLWQTNKPVHSALILKNNSVFTEDGVNPAKELKGASSLSLMLLSIMSGDRAKITENFTITESKAVECRILTPKLAQLAKVMQSIELCVDNLQVDNELGLKHINRIVLREHSGNRTEIDVKLTTISALPESVRARL